MALFNGRRGMATGQLGMAWRSGCVIISAKVVSQWQLALNDQLGAGAGSASVIINGMAKSIWSAPQLGHLWRLAMASVMCGWQSIMASGVAKCCADRYRHIGCYGWLAGGCCGIDGAQWPAAIGARNWLWLIGGGYGSVINGGVACRHNGWRRG